MRAPDFFAEVPALTLHDPLAELLGAAEGGIVEYRYIDAVRLAGHSCPTVAAAWNMTRRALVALHPDSLPQRGGIRAEFRDERRASVTGVIAAVVTLLTGATQDDGFKGLGGRFDRRNLLGFSADIDGDIRFTRVDTGAAVDVAARLQSVPFAPGTPALLEKCLAGTASAAEAGDFRAAWQGRVRALLLAHGDDPEVFPLRPVAA